MFMVVSYWVWGGLFCSVVVGRDNGYSLLGFGVIWGLRESYGWFSIWGYFLLEWGISIFGKGKKGIFSIWLFRVGGCVEDFVRGFRDC